MTGFTRRKLLASVAVVGGGVAAAGIPTVSMAYSVSPAGKKALLESPLVYISPLTSAGGESRCHGEVWYYLDGNDVIVGSEVSTWKVRAVARGLKQARLWVADYGPEWRSLKRYRNAPTFVAGVSIDRDKATFEKLMAGHARRYPDEWSQWEQRFHQEYHAGQRVLLRYTPIGA